MDGLSFPAALLLASCSGIVIGQVIGLIIVVLVIRYSDWRYWCNERRERSHHDELS